ncbi:MULTISPECIES: hypothetical protein [unclassified Devosia]|uniref:hypothetical protein n=1 Tax=unclassified Devosia TaxID=196773 RepID=UPI00145D939D|nr:MULTISPECIES: hypothetical protein [unclassified Devosia]MBJ7576974.1 hypothetical protein [Devosia sp. MC532]MBK1793798.1 hypothetical protein [Devosia sp. WQ 349K1]
MTQETINENNKEAFFKRHFIAVIEDLKENGFNDGEAMAMIGSLALTVSEGLGHKKWSEAKAACTREQYDALLLTFQQQGEKAHAEGLSKQAYAIQTLSTALVAATQRKDPHIAQGEPLLDDIIDEAITFYETFKDTTVN